MAINAPNQGLGKDVAQRVSGGQPSRAGGNVGLAHNGVHLVVTQGNAAV